MSSPTQGSCAGISGSLWAVREPAESLSLEPLSREGTGWASECHSLPQPCASGFAQLTTQDARCTGAPGGRRVLSPPSWSLQEETMSRKCICMLITLSLCISEFLSREE